MAQSPRRQPDATIVFLHILEGVKTMPKLLGCMKKIRYLDHDVAEIGKFHEFAQHFYLDNIRIGPFGDPILQPNPWEAGLENIGILNLLEIPHFGRGKGVNNYIKQLIAVLHGGFLWMEQPVSIYIKLIASITRMSSMGENPA
jgi:hypothetical protein